MRMVDITQSYNIYDSAMFRDAKLVQEHLDDDPTYNLLSDPKAAKEANEAYESAKAAAEAAKEADANQDEWNHSWKLSIFYLQSILILIEYRTKLKNFTDVLRAKHSRDNKLFHFDFTHMSESSNNIFNYTIIIYEEVVFLLIF